ncbi:MAG: fluoride efflux transporter CrcB [Akkermansiaceae bacterium]
MNFLYIFLGGGLGAVSRYGLASTIQLMTQNTRLERLPVGIFACNMVGCFFIGIVAGYLSTRNFQPAWMNFFTITGFLGGFTTFSTFALDNHKHFLSSPSIATFNIVASIIGSMIAVWLGFKIAQ